MFEFEKNTTGNFYCGKECLKKGHSKNFSGSKNPFYGKTHSKEILARIVRKSNLEVAKCPRCEKEFSRPIRTNTKNKYCSPECAHQSRRARFTTSCSYCGKKLERVNYYRDKCQLYFCNHSCNAKWYAPKQPKGEEAYWFGKKGIGTPNWKGGLSLEPYGPDFDNYLKREVRERDGHQCQLCGMPKNEEKLHSHHIDYDKKHNYLDNLISLCRSCHCKTNGNRTHYKNYFQTLLAGQKGATTIPKGSTLQANGSGSAGHPYPKGDDIVCSARKLAAVPL
jgi:uncharacterized C2H2 Zn-finger protein